MKLRLLLLAGGLCLLFGSPARASSILYDNGTNGGTPCLGGSGAGDACNENGWTVNFSYQVSDSFTLSSPGTVTGVNFWIWVNPGDSITNMDWDIGSAPGDTSDGFGNSPASSSFVATNSYGYSIYEATISIPSVSLGAGTYWLSLGGGSNGAYSSAGDTIYWDQDDGPSAAWENILGDLPSGNDTCGGSGGTDASNSPYTCSESFQILGPDTSSVPEPTSVVLLGAGLAGLVIRRLRRS